MVPRYQTMRGKMVERRFGWDCHGLPAELHSEKELNLNGRQDILKYGLARFNEHCRTSIMQFRSDWEYYVNRSARWVDFENDYRTMDLSYMESTIWAFKQLWDKGLVYEGYRVVPYSWAAQTPLSQSETRLDNSYRARQDPALTVGFLLDGDTDTRLARLDDDAVDAALQHGPGGGAGRRLRGDGEGRRARDPRRKLAASTMRRSSTAIASVGAVKGSELVGRTYQPLFPFFAGEKANGAFRVIAGDFIEMGEGTGVVHIAPAFGEDDLNVGQKEGLPVVDPVDLAGNFTGEVPPYAGLNVFEANKADHPRPQGEPGVVIRHETYDHNYPHCWRTDQPLIYKAMPSWYVAVTKFRDRMVELNKGITWMPAHVRDGIFGNWLANAHDWNISRNRFWGAPIPVWKSDDPDYPRTDVYGSLDELERDFGVQAEGPAPALCRRADAPEPGRSDRQVDDAPRRRRARLLVRSRARCPSARCTIPFENKEWFDSHFPGDFIVEYVGQTRGWFYTLMVMSTALFDRAPFRSAICHGIVLDETKQKLSKRLKNYPDPVEMFNTYGADALRWYMMSSPLMSGGDLAMPKDGKAIGEAVRSVMLPIWNAYSFFTLYANIDGIKGKLVTSADAELDRYILGKTAELVRRSRVRWTGSTSPAACAALPPFIEALNNWYIRRSRERFWKSEKDADKTAAYDTLYTVLVTLTRTMAPFLPYLTDHIHRALCDGDERASRRTGRMPRPSRSMPSWSSAWTWRGRCARRRPRCARRRTCATACRWQTLTIAHPNHAILAPLRGRHRRGGQRQGRRLRRRPVCLRRRGAGGQSAHGRQAPRPGDEGRAGRRQGGRLDAARRRRRGGRGQPHRGGRIRGALPAEGRHRRGALRRQRRASSCSTPR